MTSFFIMRVQRIMIRFFGVAKAYLDDVNLRAKLKNQFDCEYIEFSITKTDVDNARTVPLYFIEFLSQ